MLYKGSRVVGRKTQVAAVGLAVLSPLLAALVWALYLEFPGEPDLPGALQRAQLDWDGIPRTYTYYLPATVSPDPPLVLVFHGSGGDAAQARMLYGYAFEVLAEEHGFIVAYPDGYQRHFNGCRRAGPYAANEQGIDDVGFMGAVVDELARRHGIDRQAVFATGVSNGGQMALRLALEAPALVAAVAPVATSMPTADNMDCERAGEAVSFLLMNGTDDPMNPYAGGTVALYGLWGNRGKVLSSRDTVDYWVELAGYREGPRQFDFDDRVPEDDSTVSLALWAAPGRESIALYTIHGGGHGAPNPELRLPRLLGGSNRDLYAARLIWVFFQGAGGAR